MVDAVVDLTADTASTPDLDEADSAWTPDLPPLPECLTDDDCQGLGPGLPLCTISRCGDAGTCVQEAAPDGTPCVTGTPCKAPGSCEKGVCQEPDAACDDGDPCTGTACDPVDGCLLEPLDGVPCDDGDLCTATDSCVEGICVGEGEIPCDDGNPCTQDGCDPWYGCLHQDIEGPCDDGDPCTGDDQCSYGLCIGTTAACECDTDADCADKDNACFAAWTCDLAAEPRVCVPVQETETPCPDPSPCLAAACDPETEACEPYPKPDGTPCEDPLACVEMGECVAGVCVGEPVQCVGGGPCAMPACVPGEGCTEVPVAGPCDDGDPCTANDWCVAGACASLDTDCAPAPAALFRVTSLIWMGPALSFTGPGGTDVVLSEALDVALAQALGDVYAPLDLLIGVEPLDTAGAAAVTLAAGSCARDEAGVVTSCPWPEAAPAMEEAWFCLEGACDAVPGGPPPPALGVVGAPGPLVLVGALGGVLAPAEAALGGHLAGLPDPTAITQGALSLFLAEEAASLASIAPPLMTPVNLTDLLDPAALETKDGLPGWWLHLSFDAVRVPIP